MVGNKNVANLENENLPHKLLFFFVSDLNPTPNKLFMHSVAFNFLIFGYSVASKTKPTFSCFAASRLLN
jgi:hypothetical protein